MEFLYSIPSLSKTESSSLKHPVTVLGEGKPLVLVHGYPLTRQMWSRVLDPLAQRYRVIAPDLRGFADDAPDVGPFQLSDIADDLDRMLTELQIEQPVALVGLSMGGYVALEFVARYRSRVGSLFLCDTRATADSAEQAQQRVQAAALARSAGTAAAIEGMIPKLVAPDVLEHRPDWFEALLLSMRSRTKENVAHAQLAMANRRDFSSALSGFDFPTRCIVGGRDIITTPSEVQSMALKIPGAEYHLISGAGHLPPLERPEAFVAALSD